MLDALRTSALTRLLFSTADFAPYGLPKPGIPILFDSQMRLIEPACEWLLSVSLVAGRTRSPETWRTYGEALFDWFQTVESNNWDWACVSSEQVAAYRDRMIHFPSALTGRPCLVKTANLRLGTLRRFYQWAAQTKQIISPFMPSLTQARYRDSSVDMLAHVRGANNERATHLTLRDPRRTPNAIDQRSLHRILLQLSSRDRLIAEWSLETGMRRSEIVSLTLSMCPKGPLNESAPTVPLLLTKTKGNKPRRVYVPTSLMFRTRAYITEERAIVARRLADGQDSLFLSSRGTKLSKKAITTAFSRACKRASLGAHFHELRHTFAVLMLRALQRQTAAYPEMNPLLVLKVLMGHSSIRTTEIYLDVLLDDLMAVEDAIAEQAIRA